MLKQRIITALLLLAVALPALFHSNPQWLGGFGLVLILAAAWEWGRLNGLSARWSLLMSLGCGLICGIVYSTYWTASVDGAWGWLFGRNIWLLVGSSWVLCGAYWLRGGVRQWQAIPRWLRLFVGLFLLSTTWLALFQAKLIGTAFLISCLTLVWVADIAAYFAGRRWGQRKLAPGISPGKSWEGVVGGMVAVQLFAWSWLALATPFPFLQGSVFAELIQHGHFTLVACLLFLTAMSVVGDLVESLIKRSAGAKDSSQLLPGHGGVLDRMDALLPTLPLALMLVLFQRP
jgi:phosphatidate cytidylyltransferase